MLSSPKQRGFIQLELLVVVALLGYGATLLFHSATAYTRYYHQLQLEAAAQLLAADLRNLQSQVMFKHCSDSYTLTPLKGQNGYALAYGIPLKVLVSRNFAKYGCADVYLQKSIALYFKPTGSPYLASSDGIITLAHRQLPDRTKQLEINPVTGRVCIDEE